MTVTTEVRYCKERYFSLGSTADVENRSSCNARFSECSSSSSLLPDTEERRLPRYRPCSLLLWAFVSLIGVTALSLDLAAHLKHASQLASLEAKLVYVRGEVDFLRARLDGDDEYYLDVGEGDYDDGYDEVQFFSMRVKMAN